MGRNWTRAQLDAIEARNGSVLVSAAAGSGKTAVLVQRVIERLTDEKNPCSADRLLVVTFTRAAAAEMRQRIAGAIEERLRLEPGNRNLINQQMLLPSAKICTIDSFCNSLVRDNFERLDISPDFKNADDGELKLLQTQALQMTLEQLYAQNSRDFLDLTELLFSGRDDSYLARVIYDLYDASMSFAFPERWLDDLCKKYEPCEKMTDNVYANFVLTQLSYAINYAIRLSERSLEYAGEIPEVAQKLSPALECDLAFLERTKEKIENGAWDELKSSLDRHKFERRGIAPKAFKDEPCVARSNSLRDAMKKVVNDQIAGALVCTREEFIDDLKKLFPLVKKLCEAVKLFSKNFSLLKKEKNLADFNDITHMALSLLVRPGHEHEFERTQLAKSISLDYDEILIDEYQDTNKAQDMLFSSISKNNLFRVGDVKQSIYSFRSAMPEIFIDLKDSYRLYDREKDEYPAKIILKNNFRSRKSVTESINFIFSNLMCKQVGGVDYTDEEKLVFSADYPEDENECAELHLIEKGEIDPETEDSDIVQASYAARLIKKMVEEGFVVKGKDGPRKATYGDFCVLLRSVNSRADAWVRQFKLCSVPCFTEVSANFFSNYEVSLMLNILRIIDNPRQDIPLLSVMMSALYGFGVDEIAKMRIGDRKADLYSCLLTYACENEKAKIFLDAISNYRTLSISLGVEDLLRTILDETGFDAIIGAMDSGKTKQANISLLLDYAAVYEKAGYIGLSGFIGFIDRLERNGHDLNGSIGIAGQTDVVKIMTIHKSKGLEFPVCIVANIGSRFNKSDEKNNVVISHKYGVGIKNRDIETFAQFKTIPHEAVKRSIGNDNVSEEMRVLYVALTRAKEKLIMLGCVNAIEKELSKYAGDINPNSKKQDPFSTMRASSYGEWIIKALMRHEDAKQLRNLAGADDDIVLKSDFRLKVEIVNPCSSEAELSQTKKTTPADADPELLELIEKQTSYKYKYAPLSFAVSKRAASEADENSIDREYFASSRPAFMSSDGLTAAQKGTATHAFMQFADYEKATKSVESEIERITALGFITQNEAKAINKRAVKRFFEGELAKRILKSPLVFREKKFTVSVPISEVYPNLEQFSDERVVIQGIADCAFLENGKLVVVDYKTDSLSTEEAFVEKYSNQVKIYKKALQMCTDYEVGQTLLYSFKLGHEIEVNL